MRYLDPNPLGGGSGGASSGGPDGNPFGSPSDDGTFSIDLTDVKPGGARARIAKGTYPGKCIDVVKETSKSSGNPMLTWSFVITGDKEGGKEFRMWTVLTPAASWKVAEVLEALGLGTAGSAVKFKREDAIGKTCFLVIDDDKYEGAETSRLSKVVTDKK